MTPTPAILLLLGLAAPAAAGGCWTHEGSVLRLDVAGTYRAFVVERPSAALAAAGIGRGAKLFEGVEEGDWLLGSARDLQATCQGRPPLFAAEGSIHGEPPRLALAGHREVLAGCEPTGRWEAAVLSLAYSHDC